MILEASRQACLEQRSCQVELRITLLRRMPPSALRFQHCYHLPWKRTPLTRAFVLMARERVRCSSLVDRPVYPRLAHPMRASNDAQCAGPGAAGRRLSIASPVSRQRRPERAHLVSDFLCWPMPGNGVLICLTLHPAIVIAASTSSRMPSVKDTMASGLCVAN
jgi:hypothetical protein